MKYSSFYLSTLVICGVVGYLKWSGKMPVFSGTEIAAGPELLLVIVGITACAALFYYIQSQKRP